MTKQAKGGIPPGKYPVQIEAVNIKQSSLGLSMKIISGLFMGLEIESTIGGLARPKRKRWYP